MKTYPAQYKDRFGTVRTTIVDDCGSLMMVVRGVRFRGTDFNAFEPDGVFDPDQLASFTFQHGSLCFCAIKADIPVLVVTPTGDKNGVLTFELELGEPMPTGQMDRERLTLCLAVNGQMYSSDGKSGWFEDELQDVQHKLPPHTFMKTCINCAFSDYSPYGHGLFGNMICFRANKAGYLALPSGEDFEKDSYFALQDTVFDMVQETHLCPEFEKRKPGTGYRG